MKRLYKISVRRSFGRVRDRIGFSLTSRVSVWNDVEPLDFGGAFLDL